MASGCRSSPCHAVVNWGTRLTRVVPNPVAGPSEVVVDIYAASVNGADWKVHTGKYSPVAEFPYILGRASPWRAARRAPPARRADHVYQFSHHGRGNDRAPICEYSCDGCRSGHRRWAARGRDHGPRRQGPVSPESRRRNGDLLHLVLCRHERSAFCRRIHPGPIR